VIQQKEGSSRRSRAEGSGYILEPLFKVRWSENQCRFLCCDFWQMIVCITLFCIEKYSSINISAFAKLIPNASIGQWTYTNFDFYRKNNTDLFAYSLGGTTDLNKVTCQNFDLDFLSRTFSVSLPTVYELFLIKTGACDFFTTLLLDNVHCIQSRTKIIVRFWLFDLHFMQFEIVLQSLTVQQCFDSA
jgi:hypothetical protein